MAVKIFIKRLVPQDKARAMIPLFRQMRASATTQSGYITGETLRSLVNRKSLWSSALGSHPRTGRNGCKAKKEMRSKAKLITLLGGETQYDIYHYGFSEKLGRIRK